MNNSFESGEKCVRKKRKNKNFLKRERYHAKKGRFGRGLTMDHETFNYFLHILEVKMEDFTSPEDKSVFIDNVFDTTKGREIEISCNQLGCRALEKFLPMADKKTLLRFANVFSQELRNVIYDEFGGFVVQQLFASIVAVLQRTGDGSRDEVGGDAKVSEDEGDVKSDQEEDYTQSKSTSSDMIKLRAWVLKVSRFAFNNYEELIWHLSGNPILRTILESLSGLPLGSTSKGKKNQNQSTVEIGDCPIPEGPALVQECGQFIFKYSQIVDYCFIDLSSAFLQTLLFALKKVDKKMHKKLITLLLDKCYDPQDEEEKGEKHRQFSAADDELPEVFENVPATRLLDAMILTAGRSSWSKIYTRCFSNRVTRLSYSPNGNFCVQNLIKQCRKKEQLEAIFDELANNFEQLLISNKPGIIFALSESCQRLSTRQGQFSKELQSALHCCDDKKCSMFPILVAYMINFELWTRDETQIAELQVSLFGSLILQTMLKFSETIKIVNYLLSVDTKHLEQIFCDTRGCFIADAYFGSKTIGDKNREKMVRKLQGSYVRLASSKYGSRAFDAVWNWSPLKSRKLILQELASKKEKLVVSKWGCIIISKTGLQLFEWRPKDWEESQAKDERTRKLFADIIN